MMKSVTNNPSRKHHYLPECFQRQWAGADGAVERFTPGYDGSIRSKRLHPGGVGWVQDLYRIPGEADERKAQRIETEFFAPLDDAAAVLMREMVKTGQPPSIGEDSSTWASFLLAFLHRTPEHLLATFEKIKELNAELMPEAERRYAELKGDNDPPTFAEWEARWASNAIERSNLKVVTDLISSPRAGPHIINLRWSVIDLAAADHELLVGDNPVIFVPLKLADGHLAISVGPRHLFIATEHVRLLKALKANPPRRVVRLVNQLQVERATKLVIASNRDQAPFIEKHFGTRRIGSFATGLHQPPRK